MKYLFFTLLLWSFPAQAYDAYEHSCNNHWPVTSNIRGNTLKSIYSLTDKDIAFMEDTYDRVQKSFLAFQSIPATQCRRATIKILVIDEDSLDSRICFPDENAYARKNEIVFGRSFRQENTLYIVPPDLYLYPQWKSYFAHELAHHFFYDCGWVFSSDREEHKYVEKFLTRYRTTF